MPQCYSLASAEERVGVGLGFSHMHIAVSSSCIHVLVSVRAVVTACRSVETVAIFQWLCLSLLGNPGSMSRVPAGIITQQGRLSAVCKHTHIRAGISRRDDELYLWSSRLKTTRGNGYKRRSGERCLIAVAA